MKTLTTKIARILFLTTLLISISTAGFAQSQKPQGKNQNERQGPPPVPTSEEIKQIVTDLSNEILLTKEQYSKVLALHISHFKTVQEKMDAGRPNREEMEDLKRSFENSIKAVLTKGQQTLYAAILKKKTVRKNTHEMKPRKNK